MFVFTTLTRQAMELPEIGIGMENLLYPPPGRVVPVPSSKQPTLQLQLEEMTKQLKSLKADAVATRHVLEQNKATIEALQREIESRDEVIDFQKRQLLDQERKLFVMSSGNPVPVVQGFMPLPFSQQAVFDSPRVEIILEDNAGNTPAYTPYEDFAGNTQFDDMFNNLQYSSVEVAFQLDDADIETDPLYPAVVVDLPVVPHSPPDVINEIVETYVSTEPLKSMANVRIAHLGDSSKKKPKVKTDATDLIQSVTSWCEKDLNKFSVEAISTMLAHYGKTYVKPKLAAIKLLIQAVNASGEAPVHPSLQ